MGGWVIVLGVDTLLFDGYERLALIVQHGIEWMKGWDG